MQRLSSFILLIACATAPAFPAQVTSLWSDWALVDATCAPPPSPATHLVRCGDLGVFVFFSDPQVFACNPDDGGTVEAELYTLPRPVQSLPTTPMQSSGPGSLREPWAPAGKMQSQTLPPPPPPPATPERVIAIDWNDHHGQAMTSIVSQVGGSWAVPELWALDDDLLVEALGTAINDGHVVANLCRLAQEIDVHGRQGPVAVSMSFGRWSDEDVDADSCRGSLACHIARIIEHIRTTASTVFLGSAGNHRDLLFPARLDNVRSVGALDLAAFAQDQDAVPSWETPQSPDRAVDILFAGDGVCVGGTGAAAGTSNATAAVAGYLAAVARYGGRLDPSGGAWQPYYSSTKSCYLMASSVSEVSRCVPSLDQFLQQAISGACAEQQPDQPGPEPITPTVTRRVAVLDTPKPMPGAMSYARWQADTQQPTPGSDPCVPCGGPNGGGGGQAMRAGGFDDKVVALPVNGSDIALDLSGSGALDESVHIVELYLRTSNGFYPVAASGLVLAELENGQVDILVLEDSLQLTLPAEQPSFFLVAWVDIDGNATVDERETFWTSSPIYIP